MRTGIVILLLVLGIFTTAFAQDAAKIKISGDPYSKVFKVFFASENEYDVTISLLGPLQSKPIIEESVKGKGFIKKYNLAEVPPGNYTFIVKYAFEEFSQDIQILTDSQLEKESIQVSIDDLLNLTVKLINPNADPLNILFYNSLGEQLDYYFWEPKTGDLQKQFNLSVYDAYDIKVEILQNGDAIFSETYSTY